KIRLERVVQVMQQFIKFPKFNLDTMIMPGRLSRPAEQGSPPSHLNGLTQPSFLLALQPHNSRPHADSYCMNAAAMQFQRHGWGSHAVSFAARGPGMRW